MNGCTSKMMIQYNPSGFRLAVSYFLYHETIAATMHFITNVIAMLTLWSAVSSNHEGSSLRLFRYPERHEAV